ncbi:MAG: GAF domain-containing sensor histidine kinase [Anaerolineae bacterium]
MSNRFLKWLAVLGPVVFWIAQLALRTYLFNEQRTIGGDLFALTMIALASLLFSNWVFGVIEKRESEIRRKSEQMSVLHDAALLLTTELDLATVLQKVVDLSRTLVHARYGALGVLDEKGESIQQFITSGITPEQRAALGDPPVGHGLLGIIIQKGRALRVPNIDGDPRSVGFPPHHPPMHSLLGVPIISKAHLIGDLYLTDKIPDGENSEQGHYIPFTQEDENLLQLFATQAAVAIENAQLYRQTQQLAILQERERFGMDLHDGIIQSIYAIGLMLEDGQLRLSTEPGLANNRITQAVRDLNDVIRDIRNYILDLRPQRFQGRDLVGGLLELTRELRANTFLDVRLQTDGVQGDILGPEQTVEILHIVQETLTNVRKHARATGVEVSAERDDLYLRLTIEDDGVGLDSARAANTSGHGLRNMRERAHSLGAEIGFQAGGHGGTRVTLVVPLGPGLPINAPMH